MSAACKHVLRQDMRSALYQWANLITPSESSIGITSTSSSFSTRSSLLLSRLRPQQPQSRSFSGLPSTRAAAAFVVKKEDECIWKPRRHYLHTDTVATTDQAPLPTAKRPLIRYTPPGPPPTDQKHQTLTFYTITPIPESKLEDLREELFLQLVKFDITGRIYLAKDGINLHVCTPLQHAESLQSSLQTLILDRFGKGPDGAIWNVSCDQTGERVFRKLKVAVKKQLVVDGRLNQWAIGDSEAPQYLEPEEFHARLDQVGDKALLVDMRNHFEKYETMFVFCWLFTFAGFQCMYPRTNKSGGFFLMVLYNSEVGTFKTAVKMDCTTFKENMDLLDELLEGRDKSKEVLMVCTGGIRCSVSGRYLRQKGFKDVKMVMIKYAFVGRCSTRTYIKAHSLVDSPINNLFTSPH